MYIIDFDENKASVALLTKLADFLLASE